MSSSVDSDLGAISRIKAVPTILRVIAEATTLGLVVIARVTDSAWTACAVRDGIDFGLAPGDTLDVATTLCREVRASQNPVIIEDVEQDEIYCAHPTPKLYAFRSYIAVPIFRTSGDYFGTLCALDRHPAVLKEDKTVSMLTLFAELLSLQLDAEEQRTRDVTALREAEDDAKLREQFIAVLAHDLRNPLASVALAVRTLLRTHPIAANTRTVVERIERSARRMELLINDVLDLTRGRLGGGIPMQRKEVPDLASALHHVVDEVASSYPDRVIDARIETGIGSYCDPQRIEQALSNLLANAVEHGAPEAPIEVRVDETGGVLSLVVQNAGRPIPEDVLPQLFQPFYRPEGGSGRVRRGLGLGLFIVAEIAKAHGGSVDVASSAAEGTRFTLRLPVRRSDGPVDGATSPR